MPTATHILALIHHFSPLSSTTYHCARVSGGVRASDGREGPRGPSLRVPQGNGGGAARSDARVGRPPSHAPSRSGLAGDAGAPDGAAAHGRCDGERGPPVAGFGG